MGGKIRLEGQRTDGRVSPDERQPDESRRCRLFSVIRLGAVVAVSVTGHTRVMVPQVGMAVCRHGRSHRNR